MKIFSPFTAPLPISTSGMIWQVPAAPAINNARYIVAFFMML
jgi:hypothetical protein